MKTGIATVAIALCLASGAVAQESVEKFYRGKTVNITVGSAVGGGYDAYGRLVARHLGKHIPGNPTVVVQNMPGAGSNRAAGYVAMQARPRTAPPSVRSSPERSYGRFCSTSRCRMTRASSS